MAARRWESYLVGSVLILVGILLAAYFEVPNEGYILPALFLVGVGVIFMLMATMKDIAPALYEMPAVFTLAYGVIAVIIGAVWIAFLVKPQMVIMLVAFILIYIGILFLTRMKIKPRSR